jgi:hypothetical protein
MNLDEGIKHAVDLPNVVLNYSYAWLQTYVKSVINSTGPDNSIPFPHLIARTQDSSKKLTVQTTKNGQKLRSLSQLCRLLSTERLSRD